MIWLILVIGLCVGAAFGWMMCALVTMAVHQEQMEKIARFRFAVQKLLEGTCELGQLNARQYARDLLEMED